MLSDQRYNNEQELLSALSAGDEEALRIIYLRYWKPLLISANNVLKDREASEDIIQDIFVRLWRNRATLNITTSLQAYLFTATRYQVFHLIKKSAVRHQVFDNLEERFSTDAPDIPLYVKDMHDMINAAVKDLPEKCRTIYRLSREHHLSNREIAAQLAISPKTVENQLAIALKKLREALGHLILFVLYVCSWPGS